MAKNSYHEITRIMAEFGVDKDADWMAIVLFVRNLLPQLTIYTDEKKAEIQREVFDLLAQKDFSESQYENILALLDMYVMQSIGTMELEEALAREKRSAGCLLNEMEEMITAMQGVNARQAHRLDSFQEKTVNAVEAGTKKSFIITQVRGMFQELIQEFKEEARELNAKAEHFERSAKFDPLLTELHNRRAFEAYINEAADALESTGTPLCMMMIDVDHFKNVNDTYGHQAGDDVLRALARIITSHAIHYSGFAARYGGEELVILTKGLNLETATIKAEAIRASVEHYDFRVRTDGQLADESLHFTVSIGVAQLQAGKGVGSLVGAADAALYEAKNSGRNKVVAAQGDQEA